MENTMYAINSLKMMEVIDINSGSKLGYIKDLKIDCEVYRVLSIVIPSQEKGGWFNKNNDIEIPWENIRKIGIDVILVDGEGYIDIMEE
ncbi:sporulation, YlmC/YmxH family protein [Clostridium argentinense CDC 2741]|uniref:Sporulation, YlmC/YmxH family protein n=1 Tax=Clostridium argentinense CDC 2741 TaxID=1418104 RepID=A0A0C1UK53_9CLOT|nr:MULTISPECIES: YlmC/YmxH family sporulation protein [Clostridium]HAG42686.1 YlmC/YmxH family sporulation protein [Clostridium sp.]ARC84643.1 YlmC/YmxH family sporulation protein [Clostridium argentinense]KIE47665.1 sporulation, YlmC/YmxH family protein [Clostridium argentinense CDC 2741]NFF40149.1 YlmC/YmxH family sporulation protein [Clostridium argentinense]NFP50648.1 YlmC/YmxH family sporulation protein [Clostridium argentinense]